MEGSLYEIVRSEHEVVRTKTQVSFTLMGIGNLPSSRRYLQTPGYKVYKGMFRNRRLAKVVRSTWTNDRTKAHPFDSPSEARKLLSREMGPSRVANYTLERVKMRSLDQATTFASGRTRHLYGAWREIDVATSSDPSLGDLTPN